ncbi:MAG: NDP-sugar synthase [Dysgonamonadaceae bacterium]|jgi:NDP-sugar pyrophosphorylase family protein|nr:NDP-sugar synthase [Dysgonamonadaceae bacterium]
MNYAIIAAGEGSRLVEEGIAFPKPLVELNGVPLIDRLIAVFSKNNAVSVSVIVNEEMKEVRQHIEQIKADFPIHLVVRSTPSSMHSFFELSPYLKEGKFCLTTVDTVFNEAEFTEFIRKFETDEENDGMMAVTDYIDDEKPLYVSVNENDMSINDFLDKPDGREKYISGGIYCLTPAAIHVLSNCLKTGMSRMRNFQRQLVQEGFKLKAYPFQKIIDVDHASDIVKAEKWLQNGNISHNGKASHNGSSFVEKSSVPAGLKIAGVRRGNKYSPNHIGNDAAIFDLTVEQLKKMSCEVQEYSEQEFQEMAIDADIIFNMARDTATIQKLQLMEDQGKKVINSGYGIENCTRAKMTNILIANEIPHPKSLIVSTSDNLPFEACELGVYCWVKRGDSHAIHYEDVTYAKNGKETEDLLNEYALRGIPNAVLNEHLKGDLIKFYGVENTDFFYWFYPNDLNHSKFGLEAINGKAKGIPFDAEKLSNICSKAARVLNIHVYGGDCVVDEMGIIRIIDFNDWPSFAPCRLQAAPHIAQCIYEFATK